MLKWLHDEEDDEYLMVASEKKGVWAVPPEWEDRRATAKQLRDRLTRILRVLRGEQELEEQA